MNLKYAVVDEAYKCQVKRPDAFDASFLDGLDKNISLISAKGDWAAFQLLLSADSNYAINTTSCGWFSQKGQYPMIRLVARGPFKVKLSQEAFHLDDTGAYFTDMLSDVPVVEYSPFTLQSVWCEVEVPEDTLPGKYEVTIDMYESVMFEDEKLRTSVKAEIEVFNVSMKDVDKKRFYLDLWQHNCNIARKHEVELWSDDHFAIIDKYIEALAELGQKAITIITSDAAWCGQGCRRDLRYKANLFEYSMINITRKADGTFDYDFSVIRRYIDLCKKHGIKDEIALYGFVNVWGGDDEGFVALAPDYPDKPRIRYFDEAQGVYKYMRCAADIEAYIKAIEEYFVSTGEIDIVRLAADEPADIEAYAREVAHILKVAPRIKLKAAINHSEFIERFNKETNDFVPYIGGVCKEFDRLTQYKAEYPEKRFLWYICCVPTEPNTVLRSRLVDSYYIGIFTSYINFHGFLRWNFYVLPDDPRADIRCNNFPAGDTNFVYPSLHSSPLLTLRYKALKRGIQYFELLETLKETGDKEALDKAYDFVMIEKDITKYDPDKPDMKAMCSLEYKSYNDMKRFILEKLAK